MSQDTAFIFAGFVQILLGFIFFRQPGVPFWTAKPIWRANQTLTPAGVALWVGGAVLIFMGVASKFLT